MLKFIKNTDEILLILIVVFGILLAGTCVVCVTHIRRYYSTRKDLQRYVEQRSNNYK